MDKIEYTFQKVPKKFKGLSTQCHSPSVPLYVNGDIWEIKFDWFRLFSTKMNRSASWQAWYFLKAIVCSLISLENIRGMTS